MAPRILAIVAATPSRAIGKLGQLPWQSTPLKRDLAFFKRITSESSGPGAKNAVVMGRKTWESIPPQYRPLDGRVNYVVSSTLSSVDQLSCSKGRENVRLAGSVEEALKAAERECERVFVVGGGRLYADAMPFVQTVYVTEIQKDFEGSDVFFPELNPEEFDGPFPAGPPDGLEHGIPYSFHVYHRKSTGGHSGGESLEPAPKRTKLSAPTASLSAPRHEEYQYLDLVREILATGAVKGDRTGTGTKSVFGRSMRFSLRDGAFPLLTTKRTFFRGVAVELLWFLSGNTSAKTLQDQKVSIWDGNSTRAYLDSIGLQHREEGDLGPVYGFQWRHFGAPYKTMHDSYEGQGVDQLRDLVRMIKNSPESRRLILSAWNPAALKEMALPPCHMFAQFYVNDGELSCQMYQRSADMGLGVPFNIASYALLTHMLAKVCGLRAGEFIHVIGDCHVYLTHEAPLREQLEREPRPFPKLVLKGENMDIEKFKYEDFEVVGYDPHKAIKMEMAV